MSDDTLTPREVAEELGVTARTVQRWIRDGRLAGIRVGGRMRVSRASLASVRTGQGAPPGGIRPIRTVLVANRGEIAARVARTARRLGIRPVGVVAADDHPPPGLDELEPISSYLDGERIIEAARRVGADALHPGYGFLAENPDFAAQVTDAGLIWVGPPAAAIAAVGDKAAARRIAAEHSVPVLPGYDGAEQDDATLRAAAHSIGPPLLIKPSAGGGGKGMRVVRSVEELDDAIGAARREARGAFADERLIIERLLVGARHVEIQVLFDAAGDGIHLGERDCSAQRRNQKIVEEAPGPTVDSGLRQRMGAAAVAMARAVGYGNAGTVEFLVDRTGAFYFLEMNTRLQVEHPVTEAVTGRDLVADQLRIAAGAAIEIDQSAIRWRGHAIEARLYAEDPDAGFLPASGTLLRVRWPDQVRVDAGVGQGDRVTDRYDPLLAKLIVHAPTRRAAIDRLRQALAETQVLGVRTNLRFLRWLLDQPAFAAGEIGTETVASLPLPDPPRPGPEAWRAAGALLAVASGGPWGGGWRLNAPAALRLRGGTEERTVELDAAAAVTPSVEAAVAEGVAHVEVEGQSLEIAPVAAPTIEEAVRHAATHIGERAELVAPMPGRVIAVRVAEGDEVAAHQVVIVLEAMKMEHAVVAPLAGTLSRVIARVGQQVNRGELLAEVSA